jgi:hypothetical protein
LPPSAAASSAPSVPSPMTPHSAASFMAGACEVRARGAAATGRPSIVENRELAADQRI